MEAVLNHSMKSGCSENKSNERHSNECANKNPKGMKKSHATEKASNKIIGYKFNTGGGMLQNRKKYSRNNYVRDVSRRPAKA